MTLPRWLRVLLTVFTGGVVALLLIPLVVIVVFAFDKSVVPTVPIHAWTLSWFSVAWHDPAVRGALALSLEVGLAATALALVLGTLVAFGLHRFRFFGRDVVSLMLVLPIALPGIVTGLALQSAFNATGVAFSILTIIVGHATFCIVVVFNNVVARLRRTPTSFIEASADLGARPWQTFWFVTLPAIRPALVAGGLLAFALSFDEVIVTTFTAGAQNTLPLWIFGAIRLGQQLPEVNAVVVGVIVLTLGPLVVAARLSGGESLASRGPSRA